MNSSMGKLHNELSYFTTFSLSGQTAQSGEKRKRRKTMKRRRRRRNMRNRQRCQRNRYGEQVRHEVCQNVGDICFTDI